MKSQIICGDALEEMKKLLENSVDAIITDPPYGLEFMGKEWDKFKQGKNIAGGTTGLNTPFGRSKPLSSAYQYGLKEKNALQQFCFNWAKECLRVLKPGGFFLSFGGTRTYHRMVCGIEDAGFEIRDTIMWLYGSGFPKSLNIGKQIDKIQGNEREVIGKGEAGYMVDIAKTRKEHGYRPNLTKSTKEFNLTKGNSEWEGWGTALKPACEPIVVARKPLSEKSVALNVLKWGTGGMNIDESRISLEGEKQPVGSAKRVFKSNQYTNEKIYGENKKTSEQGRFPANIILDEEAGKMLDEQSGDLGKSLGGKSGHTGAYSGGYKEEYYGDLKPGFGDKGGASRFFYCAKASKSERNFGLDDRQPTRYDDKLFGQSGGSQQALKEGKKEYLKKGHIGLNIIKKIKNNHPTVKPIKLMEYLIKLVSREGAIVLDPFIGSGTTAIACLKLNRQCIGIEKEEEYVKIANARIKPFLEQKKL